MDSFLEYAYRGLLAGILIGASSSAVGLYLIVKRLSMLGAGLSHAAFGGIALALLLGTDPTLFTVPYTVLVGFLLQLLIDKKGVPADTVVSLVFSGGVALALILISVTDQAGVGVQSYLFGSVLTVSDGELLLSLLISATTFIFLTVNYRKLFMILFNEELARLKGVKVGWMNYSLVMVASANIALSIKVAGIVLSSSFVAIPPMTALLVSPSFFWTLVFSLLFSSASVLLGIAVSIIYDLPPSGAIVLVMILFFLMAGGYRRVKTGKGFQINL